MMELEYVGTRTLENYIFLCDVFFEVLIYDTYSRTGNELPFKETNLLPSTYIDGELW